MRGAEFWEWIQEFQQAARSGVAAFGSFNAENAESNKRVGLTGFSATMSSWLVIDLLLDFQRDLFDGSDEFQRRCYATFCPILLLPFPFSRSAFFAFSAFMHFRNPIRTQAGEPQ